MFYRDTRQDLRSQSFSVELFKQELKDKDEIISALKKKMDIMESFHCSSSSFEALNSFQERRCSSVVVIAENEPILSPTFKPLRSNAEASGKSSKRGSNVFRRHRKSLLSLDSPEHDSPLRTSRSASLIPSIKQVFVRPFSPKKSSEDDEAAKPDNGKSKISFFRSFFSRKQSENQDTTGIPSPTACIYPSGSGSLCFESEEELYPSFSYDEIVSGTAPLTHLNLEKIENYLKWDDCIEWLGATKEQLKLLRSNSLIMRKRSVFLCADQLKHYSKDN